MTQPLTLQYLLDADKEALLNAWVQSVLTAWRRHYPHTVDEKSLRWQSQVLLEEIKKQQSHLTDDAWEPAPDSSLLALLREIVTQRAKQGFRPGDTAFYLTALKSLLLQHALKHLNERETDGDPVRTAIRLLMHIDQVMDRLTLIVHEIFIETRERIIAQQSLSLLELSTPVVRLWDRIVMVPLIGVVDTLRARQTTERLLEAIAKYEATVAIIDVTGVPVLDTSVAGHLMKTVAAAQMLGTRVVMTGISPEGAQTLVKLGVDFSAVTTRATLRAGISEGLLQVGKRIVSMREPS